MSAPAVATRAWVEEFVVGLGLCPFAAAPLREGRVIIETIDAPEPEAAFYAVLGWLETLAASTFSTALLVLPATLGNFDDFLGFIGALEEYLESSGKDVDFQLAHFHPEYVFADTETRDPANLTNRSPYPTVQLLRVAEVAAAIERYAEVDKIPERNVGLLRRRFPDGV